MNPEPGGGVSEDRAELLRWWYEDGYPTIAASANGSVFERYVHRMMERGYGRQHRFGQVLEVGGDRGQHVPYVRHGFDSYLLTDVEAPGLLVRGSLDSRVICDTADVHQLQYPSNGFDRVIATCLLHHVDDPLLALHEMRRVARREGGVLTLLLPTDPGIVYRIGKRLTTGRRAAKAGYSDRYELLAALDHRNHFPSIIQQLIHVFRKDHVRLDWRPFRVPGWHLNAFVVVHVVRGGGQV